MTTKKQPTLSPAAALEAWRDHVRRLHAEKDDVTDLKARLDGAERERSALDRKIFSNQPTNINPGAYQTAGSWPPDGQTASVKSGALRGLEDQRDQLNKRIGELASKMWNQEALVRKMEADVPASALLAIPFLAAQSDKAGQRVKDIETRIQLINQQQEGAAGMVATVQARIAECRDQIENALAQAAIGDDQAGQARVPGLREEITELERTAADHLARIDEARTTIAGLQKLKAVAVEEVDGVCTLLRKESREIARAAFEREREGLREAVLQLITGKLPQLHALAKEGGCSFDSIPKVVEKISFKVDSTAAEQAYIELMGLPA
jgi:chromosome segregation ATPase